MPLLAYGAINDELEILYGHMAIEIVGVLALFFIIYGIYYNYRCLKHVGLNVGPKVPKAKMCH